MIGPDKLEAEQERKAVLQEFMDKLLVNPNKDKLGEAKWWM